MKTVLWISRHNLTDAQYKGLEQFCEGPIRCIHRRENVSSILQLSDDIARADVIAAVLPLPLLAELYTTALGKPILIERAQRTLIPNPGGEPTVRFEHGGWLLINQLVLTTTPA